MSEAADTVASMPFTANVLRVMIASPTDVSEARDTVERSIHEWNTANAQEKSIVLLPWRWETSAVAVMGGHPQRILNSQGVDDADIVIALFGGRLGTPTPEAVSGTAEEIGRAQDRGAPVHVFFSTAQLPHDVDTEQLDALRQFQKDMSDRGLLGEFNTVEQLRFEVWKALDLDTRTVSAPGPDAVRGKGVDFLVQPHEQREQTEIDSKGKVKYATKHWIEVTNRGDQDAHGVVFEIPDAESSVHLGAGNEPTVIHRGQTRRVSVFHTWGGSGDPILRIRWVEANDEHHRDFHIG